MSTVELNPKEIKTSLKRGETHTETLSIQNTGADDDAPFSLEEVERDYVPWVNFEHDNIALSGGETMDVRLTLTAPPNAKIGEHNFKIEVANANDPSDRDEASISLTVPIPILWWILGAIAIIIVIVVIVALL